MSSLYLLVLALNISLPATPGLLCERSFCTLFAVPGQIKIKIKIQYLHDYVMTNNWSQNRLSKFQIFTFLQRKSDSLKTIFPSYRASPECLSCNSVRFQVRTARRRPARLKIGGWPKEEEAALWGQCKVVHSSASASSLCAEFPIQ